MTGAGEEERVVVPRTSAHDDTSTEGALRSRLAALDTETKVSLLTGATAWLLHAVPEIGLGAIALSDGPAGVRGTSDADPRPSASFPSPTALSATWDEAMAGLVGEAFAIEAVAQGVDVVLAPVVNLQRTPRGGRHFEAFSEDPLLTGRMGAALVAAIQSHGIAATPKHFLGNESETDRTGYVAEIGERALREVYLAPFVDAVQAGAWLIMSAYNGVDDGVESAPMSEHGHLVDEVLKRELGFDGVVVSDWMAARRTVEAAVNGLDLAMPGPHGPWGDALLAAVRDGRVDEALVDDKVLRILRLAARVGKLDGVGAGVGADTRALPTGPERDARVSALLRRLAATSTVVLRRENDVFPIVGASRVALIGPNAVEAFTQGGGSAHVNPAHVVSPEEGLRDAFGDAVVLTVDEGASNRVHLPPARTTGPWTLSHLDASGRLLATTTMPGGAIQRLTPVSEEVTRLVVTGTVRLDGAGVHDIGVYALGRHRSRIDGEPLHVEERTAHGEDVLTGTNHNPPGAATQIVVADGADDARRAVRDVVVHVEIELPDLDDFGRWSVLVIRHAPPGPSDEQRLAAAEASARAADVAIVVVGTNDDVESEGFDRTSLALTGKQDELVRRVAATGTPTIAIINAGAPVLLPWLDEVDAALWTWFPGQECGHALADVLLGRVEPAGRLPWTLPLDDQGPRGENIPRGGRIPYTEGVFIGHRAWDALGLEPARPFGYGLGWTSWELGGARVDSSSIRSPRTGADGTIEAASVTVTVRNTGERTGTAVVQVYLEPPTERAASAADADRSAIRAEARDATDSAVTALAGLAASGARPIRTLAGFTTTVLDPGEEREISVSIARRAFEIWDEDAHAWALPAGAYRVRVGLHSRDLSAPLDIVVR